MKVLSKAKGEMDYFEVGRSGPFLFDYQHSEKERINKKIGYKIRWERLGGRTGRLWVVTITSREGEFYSKAHDHLTVRQTAFILKKDDLSFAFRKQGTVEYLFKLGREIGVTTAIR